jgi:hypothetical protein
MCRNFNMSLNPIKMEHIFFEKKEEDQYFVRSYEAILLDLQNRTSHAHIVTKDCSRKSTKAGYDAGGMAIGYIDLQDAFTYLESNRCEHQALSIDEVSTLVAQLQGQLMTHVQVSRDGGDLLRIWDYLFDRLNLRETYFITNWATHVRQASQGDMYSESNAHPHREMLDNGTIRIYDVTTTGEITFTEKPRTWDASLFSDTHNGDINDSQHYKRFLTHEFFRFISNSDSCVEPALKRFIYEHLRVGKLAGALHRLAYTDPDFMDTSTCVVDQNGCVGAYSIGLEWAGQTLTTLIQGSRILFLDDGQPVGDFVQRGFLRDDRYSLASEKIEELLTLAEIMSQAGAKKVTIVAAIVARILEYSYSKNKFVFQSFTPIGKPGDGLLGGGTYTSVRGGTRRGGEAGGEIIFYIPKPSDKKNYGNVAFFSASEENALKEQVTLLDPVALAQGQFKEAQPEIIEITSLPNIQATAYITEGVVPIFDLHPGEIVEVTADGQVRLFDIYKGQEVPLLALDGESQIPGQEERYERLAPLKVFKIEYRDEKGQPIPRPFNEYGEEIIVIQPLALRRNTEKLFITEPDGTVRLRTGAQGIGLTMDTDDEALRHERIQHLEYIVTGAAGTSFLINTIAPNLVRKLGLHALPIISLDGFTGSDTIPAYVGDSTLFLANSNSGGTSDTIKLTYEMANPLSVLKRIEEAAKRRDPSNRKVQKVLSQIPKVRADLEAGLAPPRDFLAKYTPWVYVITNIEASALGNIGRGLDPTIPHWATAGAGITNLPEEECVGSTFAAMASLQWQLALYTYIGEVRGDISSEYASKIYSELARLPQVAEQIVSDPTLTSEIERMSKELIGGNFDFVYTGYLDGVPEEQAHKAAEMIQEMFAGWHFFQFQHGKYAHMKRRTRHTLGSILGHNAPPPSWSFFNARALKSPNEMGPRVATTFFIAHESNREALEAIPDYRPDYIFTYPADSIVLYPLQVIIVSHLISYFWGLEKKQIGERIKNWNKPFISLLLQIPPQASIVPAELRSQVQTHAQQVLGKFSQMCETTHKFDNMGERRKAAIVNGLSLLADESKNYTYSSIYSTSGYLRSEAQKFDLRELSDQDEDFKDKIYLSVLKDLAIELCTREQAKQLADHFLVDNTGQTVPQQIPTERPGGRVRMVYEYDYLIEYEGLGTFYDVDPVHPPKVAKAKKGWL